jgi:nitrogen fixation protein FixH
MSQHGPSSWWRPTEVTGRMVFIALVAFFAVVGGVNAVMIHAAISTFGGVETESSYRAGLAFAREMATAQAQDALHWDVTAKATMTGDTAVVEVTARDASGRLVPYLEASAALAHPTDRRADVAVALAGSGAGQFRGSAHAAVGQWDLVIELSRDGNRLFRSKNRVWLR